MKVNLSNDNHQLRIFIGSIQSNDLKKRAASLAHLKLLVLAR